MILRFSFVFACLFVSNMILFLIKCILYHVSQAVKQREITSIRYGTRLDRWLHENIHIKELQNGESDLSFELRKNVSLCLPDFTAPGECVFRSHYHDKAKRPTSHRDCYRRYCNPRYIDPMHSFFYDYDSCHRTGCTVFSFWTKLSNAPFREIYIL